MIFEASIAFRIRTETRPSTIPGAGEGIFALDRAARGTFLGMDFPSYRKLCTDRDFPALPEEKRKYTWRHVEHVCFEAHDRRWPADFLNHSADPNVLWHLGFYFARRDVRVGDELFADYRYLYSPLWKGQVVDGASGEAVEGMDWRRSLIGSCRELAELLAATGAEDGATVEEVSALCRAARKW